jgi:hypothetical protein
MLTILTALAMLSPPADGPQADGPFAQRGYYITFMRMPTYDLADWEHIIDGIHDDGGNILLLWVAGAFRSEKPCSLRASRMLALVRTSANGRPSLRAKRART